MATTHTHERDYRGFCKALKENPDLRFREYCESIGANQTALYRWMQRRHISLGILYSGVGRKLSSSEADELSWEVAPPSGFVPVSLPVSQQMSSEPNPMRCVTLSFPGGFAVSISECTAEDLVRILGGPVGTGHV